MLQSILNALGSFISSADTIFPFSDFPNISLLRMLLGFIILIVIISIFAGKEDKDE